MKMKLVVLQKNCILAFLASVFYSHHAFVFIKININNKNE